jgi:DNA-binding NtrC family response regulator
MQRLLETSKRAAASEATLLLTAESGCGKQVLAEHIHSMSDRRKGPFVYINCVAISDELIESTLFGHERGSFTGAVQRKEGRLEAATGGTAFLDEVGDISPRMQTKLLHFLESGEFERIGGSRTMYADCRVIAATNRDLAAAVKDGSFREDLYYRLNVIQLKVPPLRERREDIPILADAFLARFADELKRGEMQFAPDVLEVFGSYPWPGNVRQLRNAVERMAVLATGPILSQDLLPEEIRRIGPESESELTVVPFKEAVVAFKRRIVGAALERSQGNQTKAAEELELQRSYLNRLIKDLGLTSSPEE